MVLAIVVGLLIGGLTILMQGWRARRRAERAVRSREQIAALVLYEEMTAAISALDLALTADGSKWLLSMSESRTLTEAWHEHGEALVGLGAERWNVLSDAVSAVAPSLGLVSASAYTPEFKPSLTERRKLLIEAAGILREPSRRALSSGARPAAPASRRGSDASIPV
jgi:hypothetical protein